MAEGLHGFAIDSVDDHDNLEAVEGLGLHEERLETCAQHPRTASRRDDYAQLRRHGDNPYQSNRQS